MLYKICVLAKTIITTTSSFASEDTSKTRQVPSANKRGAVDVS